MNHIIGFYHSGVNPLYLIGGIVKSRYQATHNELTNLEMVKGMELVEKIKELLLNSESFQRSANRLSYVNRKHAYTIISVFYDHFMAKDWMKYNDGISFTRSLNEFYITASEHKHSIPSVAKKKISKIIRLQLFQNLQTLEGIAKILCHLKKTKSHNQIIQTALNDLMKHYKEFKEDFESFIEHLNQHKKSFVLEEKFFEPLRPAKVA